MSGTDHINNYMINRTDGDGRSIYLQDRPASAPTVIFTGAPGMGKSYALGQAADAARGNGELVFRIDAGSGEPLQHRLARAVQDQYEELSQANTAETNGDLVLSDIGRVVDQLVGDRFGLAQKLLGALAPVLQRAFTWWDAPAAPTLTALVDRLGNLAQQQQKRLLLTIDNLDAAKKSDLADIAGLAEQLQSSGLPVQLVVGASAPAVDALLNAGSPSGPAAVGARYDIRECTPIPATELGPAVVAGLHRRGAAVQPDGAKRLVEEANGDPGHLMSLVDHAAAFANSPRGVDRTAAEAAILATRSADQWAYRASWAGLSDSARVIVASAVTQAKGVSLGEPPTPTTAEGLVERARTVSELVDSGILRRDGDRLMISDPGFQAWVATSIGAPESGSSKSAQRTAEKTPREKTSQTTRSTGTRSTATGTAATRTAAKRATGRSTTATRSRTAPSPVTGQPKGAPSTPGRTPSSAPTTTAARSRTRVAHQTRGAGRG